MRRYLSSFFTKSPSGVKISVIRLNGVIAPPRDPLRDRQVLTFEKVKGWVDAAFKVKGTQAVALSITCPGGAPTQTEMIAEYLRRSARAHNIPLLSFANDVAASGGYWVMCAGDELYACNSSLVGSIGVVSPNFGFVEALKRLGVERRVLAAGASKVMVDPFLPLTDEQRARAEDIMASLHSSFIDAVKERRAGKLDLNESAELFSGRVWTGSKAVKLGLVDAIGDMHGVLAQKYGHDLNIKEFGVPRAPGLLPWRMASSSNLTFDHASIESLVDTMWDAFQTRSLWARYGL